MTIQLFKLTLSTEYKASLRIQSIHQFILRFHLVNIHHSTSNMFKVLVLIACLALVVSAQYHGAHYEHKEHYAHPKYKFEYGVKDPHTGDHKTQWEVRDGDVVKGAYTLHEADGTERVVEYKSDGHNGFEANVKNVGHAHHPQVYGGHSSHGHHEYAHGPGASYTNVDKHY
ncbi:cuticle protein 8-like [Anopheles moucheti]|uniref:cuticle protein 8-like n=1 Tax=Anopheles moucheti TaxID=186751 RepID=UPI0022F01427|nr:cuticle protein 8-like [Anopheles moucheti]